MVIANTIFQSQYDDSTHGHHQRVNTKIRLYIFFSGENGVALYSRQNNTCSADLELLVTKFRLILKKVGNITRPFRYDLNQILYDYTLEMTSRFKRLDLASRVPKELWTEVHNLV